ncbi:MAG TPA: hypothetical protein VFN75_03410 [Pseudonocardiaceae bacterium]|nr:hypothetical protein [Pseudonocardiaceae bacterium]
MTTRHRAAVLDVPVERLVPDAAELGRFLFAGERFDHATPPSRYCSA